MTKDEIRERIKNINLAHMQEMIGELVHKDKILTGNYLFIVHAWQDIEYLLSLLGEKEKEIEELKIDISFSLKDHDAYVEAFREAEKRVKELEERIKRMKQEEYHPSDAMSFIDAKRELYKLIDKVEGE